MKTQSIPHLATHPGEILNDELQARGIAQKEFARDIDLKPTILNEIIKGKRSITADTALLLESGLDIPAKFLMDFQTQYELDLARIKEKNQHKLAQTEQWKVIKEYIPVNYLQKRSYLGNSLAENINRLKRVFCFSTLDELIQKFSNQKMALERYKKSEKLKIDEKNIFCWNYLAKYHANEQQIGQYQPEKVEQVVLELNTVFYENKNTVTKAETILKQAGIKFVVQEKLDKTPVDGMAFWSDQNPAIAITLRKKNIDNLAFTIMHELGHVKLHLKPEDEQEILDLDNQSNSQIEDEANDFARKALIPETIWYEVKHSIPTDVHILHASKKYKIHPHILIGRKCWETGNFAFKTSIEKHIN